MVAHTHRHIKNSFRGKIITYHTAVYVGGERKFLERKLVPREKLIHERIFKPYPIYYKMW